MPNKIPQQLKHGNSSSLILDPTRLLLAFHDKPPAASTKKLLAKHQLDDEDSAPHGGKLRAGRIGAPAKLNRGERHVWTRSRPGGPLPDPGSIEKSAANLKIPLKWFGVVYRMSGRPGLEGLVCVPTKGLLVLPRNPTPKRLDALKQLLKQNDLVVQSQKRMPVAPYVYAKPKAPSAAFYTLPQRLLKDRRRLVESCLFDTIPLTSPLRMAVPTDQPLYADQWNLQRIGMPGAWDVSRGDSHVYVCVIDNGCQSLPVGGANSHPELAKAGNYGSDPDGMGTARGGPVGIDLESPHGTACAGIATANWGLEGGLVGVAPDCRIFSLALQAPISVADVVAALNTASNPDTPLPNRDPGGTPLVDQKHRRVILLSLCHDGLNSDGAINTAIQTAVSHDVVVCVPTGNLDSRRSLTFPANDRNVIAAGAIDGNDARASGEISAPGTTYEGATWGSNGSKIDPFVTAPGVAIPSTDLMAAAGYDPTNYVMNFSGTSAAAAHVAGLAALIRSINPALLEADVRRIIARNCEKLSGYIFKGVDPNHPYGTWHLEVGYGLIDAATAMTAAKAPSIEVSPSLWKFKNAPVHQTIYQDFEIRHVVTDCSRDVTVTIGAMPDDFALADPADANPFVLANPGSPPPPYPAPDVTVKTVRVNFKPSAVQIYNTAFTVTTTDPRCKTIEVQLKGTSSAS